MGPRRMVGKGATKNVAIRQRLRPLRCYLYLAPTFVLLALFCYYPPLLAFVRSFYEWDGAVIQNWVGWGNYAELARDRVLLDSIGNQVQLTLFTAVVGVVVPFLAAELIFNLRSLRAKYWYRVLLVVPMVVPGMVFMLLWKFIYDPNVGLLNALLGLFGAPPQTWLQDPDLALYSFMFMGFPFVSGVTVLIFLAGLNNMGNDVLEAARIDGASFVQRLFAIDIPLAMGQIKLILILSAIASLNGFGAQLILSDGGPGYSTMVPALHMYHQGFAFGRLGYACAIGVVLFLVILSLTYLNMRIREHDVH